MKENNPFIKLPLYLGLAVFMFAVLLTGTKLGDNKSLTSLFTKANEEGAVVSLQAISGDTVGVLLNTKKDISGLDVTVKVEPNAVRAISSSLTAGPGYALSGGTLDTQNNTFSFSALRKSEDPTGGFVATFKLEATGVGDGLTTDVSFVTANDATAVLEKATGKNILITTQKVSFPFKGP